MILYLDPTRQTSKKMHRQVAGVIASVFVWSVGVAVAVLLTRVLTWSCQWFLKVKNKKTKIRLVTRLILFALRVVAASAASLCSVGFMINSFSKFGSQYPQVVVLLACTTKHLRSPHFTETRRCMGCSGWPASSLPL